MKWILWMKNDNNPSLNKTVKDLTYLQAKRKMNKVSDKGYTSYGICIDSEFVG